MKYKQSFFVIPLIIYPFDVCISVNQNNKNFIKDMGVNTFDDEILNLPITCQGRFTINKNNLSIIRFNFNEDNIHGVIAHEVFHCVTFIMDRIGMQFELIKSDEAYSYLIGYLTNEIYKKL